jgi:hypothetical protein
MGSGQAPEKNPRKKEPQRRLRAPKGKERPRVASSHSSWVDLDISSHEEG